MPDPDPTSPTAAIDGFSPRFTLAIALLSAAAARIIEISAKDPPDPRGDAPIGLDLAAVSGISVSTGELAREPLSPQRPRKENASR